VIRILKPGCAKFHEYRVVDRLSGAAGQLYGSYWTDRFASGWQSNLDTLGAVQFGYLGSFFTPLAWWNLVPDQSHQFVTLGYGTLYTNLSISMRQSRHWIWMAYPGFNCFNKWQKGSRKDFGALLLGAHRNGKLRYFGHSGTGFSDKGLADAIDRLRPFFIDKSPVENPPNIPEKIQWVEPRLVCEVAFAEWTEDGELRQTTFLGWRDDKNAKEVVLEKQF
jgi:ATP dependent DNA ligase C terminal region